MTVAKKDTIYIDVDDEITAIIGKVRRSPRKIIALVLPKRAAALQSTVNMKLLKREADEGKKSIVLITSELALLPLAGVAGLHVAKTLQSKPIIPVIPAAMTAQSVPEIVEIDPNKSIAELSGDGPMDEEDETIDVDYTQDNDSAGAMIVAKEKSNKKLKIPNFERFRLGIILACVLGIGLLVGGYWAFYIAPTAKIIIKTDTNTVNTTLDFTANPATKTLDTEKLLVPAITKDNKKTASQKATSTGQKDNGTKATGTITLTNCIDDGQTHTVPAGTAFSSGQFTFLTDKAVTLEAALYSGSTCKSATFGLNQTVAVTAATGGDQFNLSARNYTSPAAYVTSSGSIQAAGSNMTGGTSNIVKVVSQSDVDTAKQQVLDKIKITATDELKKQLSDQGMFVLADSLTSTEPTVVANPAVGAEGADTTVTITVTYTITALTQNDLKQLIEHDVKQKIDPSKQVILDKDDGLGKAVVKLGDKAAKGDIKVNLVTSITAGPQLDGESIKKEVAGKKKGNTISIIQGRPGIKSVDVSYKPFWVLSTPKKTSKITVVFEKSNDTR